MFKRLMALPLLILFVFLGIFFTGAGFEKVQSLRRIERIPRVAMAAVIPGEANISGRVALHEGKVLHGPDSGSACVYYHYTVERKTTDSDGDTRWETIKNDRQYIPFRLVDETGALVVYPGSEGTVSLLSKHSRTADDLRYNESRIDPGMTVFAMGVAERQDEGMSLHFEGPGVYVPILSVRGEDKERGSVGLGSLLLTVIGLLFLSLAMYSFTRLFAIHRTLAYLTLVTLTVAVTLAAQSHRMIREDLRSAFARLEREQDIRAEEVASRLVSKGIRWDGDWPALSEMLNASSSHRLDVETAAFLSQQRVNLMRAITRAERIRQGFPERMIAESMGLKRPVAFTLLPVEEDMLSALETQFHPSRISGLVAGVLVGGGLAAALLLGGLGLRRIRIKRWVENIPTVKTMGVVYGLNEVKGTVELPAGAEAFIGPLSQLPCSCYHYVVKEKRSSGKKTEWVTITDEKRQAPFLCRDGEGELLIHPDKAEIVMKARTRKSKGKLHYEEYRLPIGGPLYALGCAVINPKTHDSLVMAKGADALLPFVLSDYQESELVSQKVATGFLFLTFGLNAFSLAAFSLAGYRGGFGVVSYQAAALAPLVYMILFFLSVLYNDQIFLRRRCDAMWANIDVALKKRFELLPSLVTTAKAYVEHEQLLQVQVSQLRAEGMALAPAEAGQMVAAESSALHLFAGLVEAYPELKADKTMQDLMQRIRNLENEVSLMREGYNSAVEVYNTRVATFPDVLLAKVFHFQDMAFFRNAG